MENLKARSLRLHSNWSAGLVRLILSACLIATPALVIFPSPSLALSREEAIELQAQANDLFKQAENLSNEGKLEEALQKYEAALHLFHKTSGSNGAGMCLLYIGAIRQKLSDYDGALAALEASLRIWREANHGYMPIQVLASIGRLYEQQGQTENAIATYEQAVIEIEDLVFSIRYSLFKQMLLTLQKNIVNLLTKLLWEGDRLEDAFNHIERAKARLFLDQLAHGPLELRGDNNPQLGVMAEELNREMTRVRDERRIARGNNDWAKFSALERRLGELQTEHLELQGLLEIQSGEIASLQRVDVASLAEIQNELDADTTLVQYFVGENQTLAFIITRDGFEAVGLQVSQSELTRKINAFRRFARLNDPHPAILKQLHQRLIAPLQPYLKTGTIGIIPDGVLHYLPFAALTDGDRYLIDDYALFALPSASVLRFLPEKRKPSTGTMLALGNPTINQPGLATLESTVEQVEAIASIYEVQPLLGEEASETTLRSRAGEAEILQILAHGQYNPDNPLFSTLYLAADAKNDGDLQVREIYGLDLTKATNLVVLGACELQKGDLRGGDEVVAMNRAFLYAGTPSVMANLWIVKARPTALLLEHFYRQLRSGLGKAEALREAQMKVREEFPHPYYWSAFVLTGDWKNY